MAYNSLMVFTGNANPKLAADVAQELYVDLGRAKVGPFLGRRGQCRAAGARSRTRHLRPAIDLRPLQ